MYEIFGPYQLIDRLASGGMAEIFKAKTSGHSGFEKILVIKRLHPRYTQTPEFVEMLKDEAKTAVALSHANIVQIFDLGRVQEHYYIAMEYINGRDLNQLMNKLKENRGLIPVEAALYLVSEVCSGLDYAHRQRDAQGRLLRLIHRDISPQNIMISIEGEVKIVDFGIAKSIASHQETEAGVIKGKFCFMSPEQARGQRLDHRTDIFSAGIMLYELLAGRPMYDNQDDHQLLQQVRNAQFFPLEELRPDLPRAIHKLVNKALSLDREQRYPSARHLQHALEKVMQRCGYMFSRFQLGQLLTTNYPHLSSNQEEVINNYDDFDHEEVSLISDYEAQQRHDGDWDIPEFTDELEDLDLEEIELEEHTNPSYRKNSGDSAQPGLYSRSATPVPVGSGSNGHHNYAPAAPSPSHQNLFDPRYDRPNPSALGVSGHAQVTQPPQGVRPPIDQEELYSAASPQRYEGVASLSEERDSFGVQVDSTMILDDEPPAFVGPSKGKRSTPELGPKPKRKGKPKMVSSQNTMERVFVVFKDGLTLAKGFLGDPRWRYVIAAFLFVSLFTFAVVLKSYLRVSKVRKAISMSSSTTASRPKPPISTLGAVGDLKLVDSPTQDPPSNSLNTNLESSGFTSRLAQRVEARRAESRRAKRMRDESRRDESRRDDYRRDEGRRDEGRRDEGRRNEGRRDDGRRDDYRRDDGRRDDDEPNERSLTSSSQSEFNDDPLDRSGRPRSEDRSRMGFDDGRDQDSERSRSSSTRSIRVQTEPPGAEVAINDEWHSSTTPISAHLPIGQMTQLTFSKEGYEELREKVWPRDDETVLRFTLKAQMGHLIINSDPPGVTIKRDGETLGETPYDREDIPLKPAEFRVELSKQGYKSKAYRMSWLNADRGTLELETTLEKNVAPQAKKRQRRRTSRPKPRKPSGSGYMSVKASRWGHLFVDNRFVKEGKIVLKHRVSAGRHRVKFCFEGDRGNCAQKSVSINNGAHEKIFF